RSKRTHTVGVVVFDLTDPYCTQIWRGIQNHLRPMGLFPIVTDLQDDRSQFQPCLDMLLGRQVEGIISIHNALYLDTRLLFEFAQRGFSAVVIGRELANVPVSSVVVDNAAGTRQALQHLYNLGHSHIAFIKGPAILVDSVQRWHGLESFAEEVGLKLDPTLVLEIKGRNSTYAEACELTEELMRRRPDFTALVAFDDVTACAAIRAMTQAGRRLPQGWSVVGCDDTPSSDFHRTPLTTG